MAHFGAGHWSWCLSDSTSAALNVSYGQEYFFFLILFLPTFFLIDRGGLSTKPFAKTLYKKKRRAKSHKEISIERNRLYILLRQLHSKVIYTRRAIHI